MKSFFLYLTFFAISLYIVSCGDDNTTNNNNNGGGNETLIYERDTFNIETSQSGNFYVFNQLNAQFDSSTSIKITFSITHNLDSTDSRGVFVWLNDSLTNSNLRGNHTFTISGTSPSNTLTFYNVIYFSNSILIKYIRAKDLKIYKIN
jgi:hypothetical protein